MRDEGQIRTGQIKVGPTEALRILAGFRSEAIDKLNEHTDAIERHVERFIALDNRVTDAERYANAINNVFGGQVNDLADRIAKLEERISSLEGVHVNASIKHAERLDALEAQQRSIIKALGNLVDELRVADGRTAAGFKSEPFTQG